LLLPIHQGKLRYRVVRNEETWLKASALEGSWQPAGKLPESFQKLPNDDNWKEVKASLPGKKLSTKNMPTGFLSYAPVELILLKGEPKYEPVTGTNSYRSSGGGRAAGSCRPRGGGRRR